MESNRHFIFSFPDIFIHTSIIGYGDDHANLKGRNVKSEGEFNICVLHHR